MFGENIPPTRRDRKALPMNCPHCKSHNLDNRNYCGFCGAQLGHYCRLCGFRNQLSDRFCGGCGTTLTEGASQAPGQVSAEPTVQPPSRQPEPPAAIPSPVDQGLSELLDIAATAQEEPEEKPDAKVTQDDIDSLFGN